MTDIWTWPAAVVPQMRTFRPRPYNISALAAQTQELIPGGLLVQRFEAEFTMPELDEEDWLEVDGLLAELAGVGGLVRLWDPARKEPRYNRTVDTTTVNWTNSDSPPVESTWDDGTGWEAGKLPPYVSVGETARRGVTNILLKGFPASLSGVLRRGDLIEFRPNGIPAAFGHLAMITGWANSNSSGECRIRFKPGLRRGLRTGDMAVIGGGGDFPTSLFRLASDDEGKIELQPGWPAPVGNIGLRFIEVLPHG